MHECIKISDKNIVPFASSPVNNKSTCLSSQHIFWYLDWIFFLIFITKNTNADRITFFNFVNVFSFYWKFYGFKVKLFSKIFTSFCNFDGLGFPRCNYLGKHHLRHWLSSIFWILIKLFFGWSNSLRRSFSLLARYSLKFTRCLYSF